MSEQHKFWLVWGIGKPAPTMQHPNPLKAEEEAKRLALKHPGVMFVVMESSKAWRTAEPSVEPITLWLAPDAFDEPADRLPPPLEYMAGTMPGTDPGEALF